MTARFHADPYFLACQCTVELFRLRGMCQSLLLELSSVGIHRCNLLKLGMVIDSYNDHCSAPFSRACWLVLAPPTLLGRGSRHCHGINYTHQPMWTERPFGVLSVIAS